MEPASASSLRSRGQSGAVGGMVRWLALCTKEVLHHQARVKEETDHSEYTC
jgi:hypothetical protein